MVSLVRKGRGAASNRDSRFLDAQTEACDDGWGEDAPVRLVTSVTVEHPRSVVTRNRSPDVPFEQSVNPYRGCEHGCVYCYARPTHAYLGLSPGQDFESRLFAKVDADRVLEAELSRPGYRCQPIALGTNTDPYQPVERGQRITRRVLEVLSRANHPVLITTKSSLVERDLDVLAPMAERGLVRVYLSIGSLDHGLAAQLEPRATAPRRRMQTLARLVECGVPCGVICAPMIPVLNEHELEGILEQAAGVGVQYAGYVLLRLPIEVKGLFREWLDVHRPAAARHVMTRLQAARGGADNDARFGTRMSGEGPYAELLRQRFALACRRLGLNRQEVPLEVELFQPPGGKQLSIPGL